jgi:Ca-activated chloride channel family protein
MNFLNPEFFWLLLFILAVWIKKDHKSFSPSTYGYVVTFVFIVIALSRPVIEQKPIKTKQKLNDVVVAVDLSYSMQAKDLKPTRLEHSKKLLEELVSLNKKTRFGVLGFTTNAIVLSPLTQDSEILLHMFNTLDHSLVVTKGSSIMPALELARKLSKSKRLSVVFFTDGGDKKDYLKEARFAKENNMVVNIMMMASTTGSTLSLRDGELLEDESGNIVISRENSAIKVIASTTGGVYTKSLSDILSALNSQRDEFILKEVSVVQNKELFYYFVFLAIISFLVSVTSLKRVLIPLFILFGVNTQALDLDGFYKANELYEKGKYEQALEIYTKLKSSDHHSKAIVFYNTANTYVRLKEFKKARENYMKSLTLEYSKEAYENMRFIKDVGKNKQMNTGNRKSKKRSANAKENESSKKTKDGGGSNMNVSASAGASQDKKGKKVDSAQNLLDLSESKAKLSSRQYELINKRGTSEKQPW